MKLKIEIELSESVQTTRDVVMSLVASLPRGAGGPENKLVLLDSGKVEDMNGKDCGWWEVL
jgi:hypothetical protein